METQSGYLKQLQELVTYLGVPVVYAGDIFDRWNAPAKLCNFLIDNLPKGYAIPGQHDLPYHSWELIEDSGFMNLCKAGTITLLEDNQPLKFQEFYLQGFGWNKTLGEFRFGEHNLKNDRFEKIAIIHKYTHCNGRTAYAGASNSDHCRILANHLKGFTYAVFGDNHIPFQTKFNDRQFARNKMIQIINCGSFMRRKTDERFHRPAVYVIYKSKNNERLFDRYLLDVSKDVITWNTISDNQVSNPEDILGSSDLIESIMALHSKTSDTPITFSETVRAYLKNNSIGKKLTEVILKALGE